MHIGSFGINAGFNAAFALSLSLVVGLVNVFLPSGIGLAYFFYVSILIFVTQISPFIPLYFFFNTL